MIKDNWTDVRSRKATFSQKYLENKRLMQIKIDSMVIMPQNIHRKSYNYMD
jgi:hypothetical protein